MCVKQKLSLEVYEVVVFIRTYLCVRGENSLVPSRKDIVLLEVQGTSLAVFFFSSPNSPRVYGSGLDLSIARNISSF